MTRENHQRYMEGFGAALLQEDYFGAVKPVMAAPLKATSVVRARPASVVRRAAARSLIRVKSNVMQAVRAGTMSADQAQAVLNRAGKVVSATGAPVYVRSAKVQKTLSAAGPQAPGADPATALVKAPTLYTSRLSEEEEALLREDSPEIQEKFRLAIEKLKRGVSKRSRTMMGFDEFGYDPDEDDDYDDFGANLLAEEEALWDDFGGRWKKSAAYRGGVLELEAESGQQYTAEKRGKEWVVTVVPSDSMYENRNPWGTGTGRTIAIAKKRALRNLARTLVSDFGGNLLAEEAELWDESYVDQFGYDNITQWEYDKQHGGTRWGPRSMGGGYGTF